MEAIAEREGILREPTRRQEAIRREDRLLRGTWRKQPIWREDRWTS